MKKNRMRKITLLCVLCLLMSALAGCGSGGTNVEPPDSGEVVAPADDAPPKDIYNFIQTPSRNPDKVLIRWASMASEETLYGQAYTRGYVMLLKWLKEELGDKIEVQFLLNSTVGGTADAILGNLQMGNIEMADFTTTSCGEFSKAYTPLDLFYLVKTFDGMGELLDGEAGDTMNKKFEDDTDIKNISYGILGPRNMTNSRRAVTSVDDMKGLKMRVQSNQLHMMGMKALGASATNIAFSELFTALQQGTVDGQENPIDTIYQHNYYEVQNYLTMTNHLVAVSGLFVSSEWYNSLDSEIQAAIEKYAPLSEAYGREAWAAENNATLDKLREVMEVTELNDATLSEFQEAAKSSWASAAEFIGVDYLNEVLNAAGLSLE